MSFSPKITVNAIQKNKQDECGEVYQNIADGCKVKSDINTTKYEVLYPVYNNVIPLAGGSIISFDAADTASQNAKNPVSVFEQELLILDDIQGGDNILQIITSIRNTVNKVLNKVGSNNSFRKRSNFPEIYISTYVGNDLNVSSDDLKEKYIPSISKICEFKFIPFEIINNILEVLAGNPSTRSLVGISGYSFENLSKLDNEKAYLKVLELFTIFNISEDSFLDSKNIALGGYYTFFDNKYFLKMPDLSGKNSFGISNDIFEDRRLFFEILSKNDSLIRLEISDFEITPSIIIADELPDEITPGQSLSVSIQSNKELKMAFLSPISKTAALSKTRGISTYTDAIEIFSIPVLSRPVIEGGLPTLDIPELFGPEYATGLQEHISSTFSFYTISDVNNIGVASDFQLTTSSKAPFLPDPYYIFGEANRPEILLLDSTLEMPKRKNDNKYYQDNIFSSKSLFAGVRPKIYLDSQIPDIYPKTSTFSNPEESIYTFTFSEEQMSKLEIQDNFSVVLYVIDDFGQIARAPSIINFEVSTPTIEAISPNGFISSSEISPFDNLTITIFGQNLKTASKIDFLSSDSGELALRLDVDLLSNEDYIILALEDTISIKTLVSNLENGLTPSQTYNVVVENDRGKRSNEIPIYISDGEGTLISLNSQSPVFDKSGEIKYLETKNTEEYAVPISYGSSANLSLKSKSGYFNERYNMYAYFATGKENRESLKKIEFDKNIKDFSLAFKDLSVCTRIEYTLNDSSGDFYSLSNKKAILSFPGSYSKRNFQSFIDDGNIYYILFTSKDITAYNGTIPNDEHYLLSIGNLEKPAFIQPPNIYGIISKDGSGSVTSTIKYNLYPDLLAEFGEAVSYDSKISCFEKIEKLAIMFYGVDERNINSKYDFYIGNTKISKKLSKKIFVLDESKNLLCAQFKNIKISEQSEFPIFIKKKYKEFGLELSSEVVNRNATYEVSNDNFQIELEDAIIINDIKKDLSEAIPAIGSGIAINTKEESDRTKADFYQFLNDINITSNIDLLLLESATSEFLTLSSAVASDDISSLYKNTMNIPGGTLINNQSYVLDDVESPTTLLAFLNLGVTNPYTITFNTPKILKIGKGRVNEPEQNPNDIVIEAGNDYTIEIESADEDFIIVFDNDKIVKPKGKPKKITKYRYQAVITAPDSLISLDCPKICASITNADRKRAKKKIGDRLVVDIDNKIDDLINGITKKKIPSIDDLKDLIEKFPLRFANVLLDKASIPQDLINSFCDMSFHLTADLKIALNGFQVLMIPIQVIFCIIDVICALLNPRKVAKAVIRLFQCLYDLILLLPQISVPVMFIQLILHLLKLLECVFDKILRTLTVINEIIKVLQNIKEPGSIKTLEEILSEHLLDLKVSLSVLDPIVSILSIFLQLLGLVFRFPCSITDSEDENFCLNGSIVHGLVIGKAAKDDDSYYFDNLLPVIQAYSDKSIEQAVEDNTSDPLVYPEDGDVVAVNNSSQTYLESMNVDQNSLKSTYAGSPTESNKFNATFAASVTKSKKGFGKPSIVKFLFKERGQNGFFNKKKIIDPEQTLDAPIIMLKEDNNSLVVDTGSTKNIISPIDSEKFLSINGSTANVLPLTLTFDIPTNVIDEETGKIIEVSSTQITRTFDEIPKMAILDENFNVYFIEKDGIEIEDGAIKSIKARIINYPTAPKLKFTKEDEEVDTDDDDVVDEEAAVFDFDQIHFFDMRAISEEIQAKCISDSFDEFVLENSPDDIAEIVQVGSDCISSYLSFIDSIISNIRNDMENGLVPSVIDLNEVTNKNSELEGCLEGTVDEICKYVVNTLNSQFKIIEDLSPNEGDSLAIELTEELLDGFEESGPNITGAREYAAGIGDSIEFPINESATIQITPRDAYDNVIIGDLSSRISLNIISDTTGSARFIDDNGEILSTDGESYFAKITSSNPGVVKITAKVCDRTIQAVTYSDIADQVNNSNSSLEVDCVPNSSDTSNVDTNPFGALTRIDRILTIYFASDKSTAVISTIDNSDDAGSLPKTNPQVFGSDMEN